MDPLQFNRQFTVQGIGAFLDSVPLNDNDPQPHNMRLCRMREILKSLGFEYVGQGSFKEVFGHPKCDFVVKLLHMDEGANEVKNYEVAPATVKPFLVPVLFSGNRVQIQRRAYASLTCNQCGCDCWIPGVEDSHAGNHVHDENGAPVIFDYGQTVQWVSRI